MKRKKDCYFSSDLVVNKAGWLAHQDPLMWDPGIFRHSQYERGRIRFLLMCKLFATQGTWLREY